MGAFSCQRHFLRFFFSSFLKRLVQFIYFFLNKICLDTTKIFSFEGGITFFLLFVFSKFGLGKSKLTQSLEELRLGFGSAFPQELEEVVEDQSQHMESVEKEGCHDVKGSSQIQ